MKKILLINIVFCLISVSKVSVAQDNFSGKYSFSDTICRYQFDLYFNNNKFVSPLIVKLDNKTKYLIEIIDTFSFSKDLESLQGYIYDNLVSRDPSVAKRHKVYIYERNRLVRSATMCSFFDFRGVITNYYRNGDVYSMFKFYRYDFSGDITIFKKGSGEVIETVKVNNDSRLIVVSRNPYKPTLFKRKSTYIDF